MTAILRTLNRAIGWSGFVVVERCGVKSLIEKSNVVEHHHPARTGAARWLRHVASVMPLSETDRNSETVRAFRSPPSGGEGR